MDIHKLASEKAKLNIRLATVNKLYEIKVFMAPPGTLSNFIKHKNRFSSDFGASVQGYKAIESLFNEVIEDYADELVRAVENKISKLEEEISK